MPVVLAVALAPPNPDRFAGELRHPALRADSWSAAMTFSKLSAGDVLSDAYRVDAVTENEVVLVHIATGVRHVLAQKTT